MQMLAGTAEHLEMAAREVQVMQRLRHPNLLPLLACERRELQGGDQDGVTAFYMLFDLFPVRSHSCWMPCNWHSCPKFAFPQSYDVQHSGWCICVE